MKKIKEYLKKSQLLPLCIVAIIGLGSTQKTLAQETASETTEKFTAFKGKVYDAKTKKPLVFASISIQGTNASTISNAQGDYLLKVPKSLLDKAIVVSFIGYKTKTIALDQKKYNDFNLSLEPTAIALNEVNVVIPKDAKALVRETLEKKGENYFNDPTLMTAFYRETIKKRRRNVSLSEAVVSIYKSSYASEKQDAMKLYKSRKSTDYSKLDTLALKLQGGPFNTLYVDVMKYPEYLFSDTYIDLYKFSYGNTTKINDQVVYIVNFEPLPYNDEPLFRGSLYIDASHKILTRATFTLDTSDTNAAARMFVRRKPKNAKVWPTEVTYRVDYREKNNKWYYGYSNLTLEFKINWDDKLFNSVYSLNCEMAITDWEITDKGSQPKRRDLMKKSIILTDETLGFSDPDFWGDYNIIEPEKSIENAIKKIKRQLSKAKDKRTVKP